MKLFAVSIVVVTIIGIAGSNFVTSSRPTTERIEAQRVELFKWMDEVEFPSATKSEFYEITISAPRPCNNQYIVLHGFLI